MYDRLHEAKKELIELEDRQRRVDNIRDEIVERREVTITESQYSNGIYLQVNDIGFIETLDFLSSLSRRYLEEIQKTKDFIYVLEELLTESSTVPT